MRSFLLLCLLVIIIGVLAFGSQRKATAALLTLNFNPVADSYVDSVNPAANNGSSTQIRIDGSPVVRSYLRFNVTGITGTVSSATLKIYANSSQSTGFEVHKVPDSTWAETTINYNNSPLYNTAVIGTSGPLKAGIWYGVDVTSAISGNGPNSFLLLTTNSTAESLASRESAYPPQLVIIYSDAAVQSPTSTPTITPDPTLTATPTVLPTATPAPSGTATPTLIPTAPPTDIPTSTPTPMPTAIGFDPVVMAAGDIICDSLTTTTSSCQQMAASQVAVDQKPDALLILGDLCHTPSANCFTNYYNASWGRLFPITHPTTGNHDYLVSGAIYYYDYWNGIGNVNGPAGNRNQGYYSFDIGEWHLISLNSQCSTAGGCNAGSPQYIWLQQDLINHPNKCTLAYYHIPLFSSGGRANSNMKQIYTLLYNNNVDVVLDGHDHIYERFAPQNPSGQADALRGIREFIVGTGGANHTSIAKVMPNSEVRNIDTFGALKLTLHPTSYDWQFVPQAGKTFTDSGTNICH